MKPFHKYLFATLTGLTLLAGPAVRPARTAGEEILTLKHKDVVRAVAFSPDGKRLAIAMGNLGEPGTVKVCEADSGKEILTFSRHTRPVLCVSWSPDGKRLAAAAGREVRVWKIAGTR